MNDEPRPVLSYEDSHTFTTQPVVIGYVGLKVFGLWLLLTMFSHVLTLAVDVFTDSWLSFWLNRWSFFSPILFYGGTGAMLIVFARPLATRLFRMPGLLVAVPASDTVVALIVVGVGLYMTATSAVALIDTAVAAFVASRRFGGMQISGEPVPWVRHFAGLGVGLWLFLRPNWVVGQWRTRTRMP